MTCPEELNAGKFLEKNLALDMTTGRTKGTDLSHAFPGGIC